MTQDWQTLVALLVVLVTLALLARSLWAKRKNPGCSSGCGCPSTELKKQFERRTR